MEESNDQVADLFDIVNEHRVAKLLFRIIIAPVLRQVLPLEALDS